MSKWGRLHVAGQGARGRYFPVGRRDLAGKIDLRVIRELQRLALLIHGSIVPSSLRPGHEERMEEHHRRIGQALGRPPAVAMSQ